MVTRPYGTLSGFTGWAGRYLPVIIDAYRATKDTATHSFLGGYLASLFEADRHEWEAVIGFLIRDNDFARLTGPLTGSSGYTDGAVEEIILEYDKGRLDVASLRSLNYSFGVRGLKEETVLAIIDRFVEAGEIPVALNILFFVYCHEENPRVLPRDLTLALLSMRDEDSQQYGNDFGYEWGVVAQQFMSQYPEQWNKLLVAVLDMIAADSFLYPHSPVTDVLKRAVQSDPKEAWSMVASKLDAAHNSSTWNRDSWNLIRWLGPDSSIGSDSISAPLTLFPYGQVLDWVAAAPNERGPLIAMAVPKTLEPGDNGRFARELLDQYGDLEEVRYSLVSHFLSGGYFGSGAEHYRKKRDEGRRWLEVENSMRVRTWIESYIDHLTYDIKREEIEEERRC